METQQNIYQLYESNIGIIVPMIKETLDKAIKEYPYIWIERAVAIAVKRDARNWRFVDAILKRWKVDGPDDKNLSKLPDRHDDYKRYGDWENV